VSNELTAVSKFDVGVWVSKLNVPPNSCIPSSAKMKMNRKRRKRSDMMEDKAFIRAITRLRRGDQYLKRERERERGNE
jgi:Ni/Co efflux regulator RcnB